MSMRAMVDQAVLFVARLGPCGLSPRAPGTVGSAVAAAAAPWLFLPLSPGLRLAVLAVLFVGGARAATRAERLLNRKDPSSVVVDELVGQWIALIPLPAVWAGTSLPGPLWGGVPLVLLLAGFCLFRLFDITKPGPVRASENWLPAGWGVMIDDVVAGAFAMILMAAAVGVAGGAACLF